MLRLRGLSMSFGGVKAIDNLDLDLGDRVVGALIGANGAGKTTVLNVINRFYESQMSTFSSSSHTRSSSTGSLAASRTSPCSTS